MKVKMPKFKPRKLKLVDWVAYMDKDEVKFLPDRLWKDGKVIAKRVNSNSTKYINQ